MYAAHLAAGLAIKGHTPAAPTWALLTGVFVPDLVWIVLAARGIEPTESSAFFDDWSHSLLMIVIYATLFAALFWRRGRAVAAVLWLAVFSHFLLDLPIHPKALALYPHAGVHLGLGLSHVDKSTYWWVQLGVLLVLAAVYVRGARRHRLPANLVAASCVLLVSLHLLMR